MSRPSEENAARRWWEVHSLLGVLTGCLLFVIFWAGVFALLTREMTFWEHPQRTNKGPLRPQSFDAFIDRIEANGQEIPDNANFFFGEPWKPGVEIAWGKTVDGVYHRTAFHVDADGNVLAPSPETGPTEFFLRLHYLEMLPGGLYLTGFLGIFLGLAILSGVAIRWGKLMRWFYRFRPARGWHIAATDLHVALGLVTLPFQLVLGLTGVMIAFGAYLYAPAMLAFFQGDQEAIRQTLGSETVLDPPVPAVPLDSIDACMVDFERRYPRAPVTFAMLRRNGEDRRTAMVGGKASRIFYASGSATYNLDTGHMIELADPVDPKWWEQIQGSVLLLHFATFGGSGARLTYFVLGLISSAVIWSGLALWLETPKNGAHGSLGQRMGELSFAVATAVMPASAWIYAAWPLGMAHYAPYVDGPFFVIWLIFSLLLCPPAGTRARLRRALLWSALGWLVAPFTAIAARLMDSSLGLLHQTAWQVLAVHAFFIFLAALCYVGARLAKPKSADIELA